MTTSLNDFHIPELIESIYKDKISADLISALKSEYAELLKADAECRRAKKAELIRCMAHYRIELEKFENTYNLIIAQYGNVYEIEKCIFGLKMQIEKISIEKNA